MKCFAALAFAGALAAPAAPEYGPGTTHYAGSPPLEYMGDQAAVTFYVMDVSPYCGKPQPGYRTLGCSFHTDNGTPVIVMLNPCPFTDVDAYAQLACHEIAHLRGWSGTHDPYPGPAA